MVEKETMKSAPVQIGQQLDGSSVSGSPDASSQRGGARNSTGKRFVRRARRWAQLQQRRQFNRAFNEMYPDNNQQNQQQHWRYPEPPPYDYVEMASMGSAVWVVDEDQNCCLMPINPAEPMEKESLGPRRSYPCTVLHPRRQEPPPQFFDQPVYSSPSPKGKKPSKRNRQRLKTDMPVYCTQALNEYGHPTFISVYQTPPELTVYPMKNQPTSWPSMYSLQSSFEEKTSDTDKMLSLITADMSAASISSSADSSPSSSGQENDEFFVYPPKMFGRSPRISRPIYVPKETFVNTAPPPERSWVMIRHADPDRPIATFTVLCYNVLCDKYATVNQYSYCPSWALNWEYRKMAIMKEIRNYESDIITLQEVETEQYKMMFLPELKKLGYSGTFSPKSRAKTMGEEERKYVDGCAIFWKSDKFDLERQHTIEFTQLAMKRASMSENMLNRVMPRDNIALCAVLKIKESVYTNRRVTIPATDNVVGNPLVVCTAHIHWDPEFCDVKLVQTMMLAHEVYRLLEEVAKHFGITTQQCPVLICGDLNSLPDSGVFEYLSRGNISRQHMDLKSFRDDVCLDKFSTSSDRSVIQHPLRLDSAVEPSTNPFTNYTLDFKGMIDYIFSTPQSLARLGVLGSFDSNWVSTNKILGFPHPHVPSDHIPIMAQYAIIPTSHQRVPPPPVQLSSSHIGVIGGGIPSHALNGSANGLGHPFGATR